MSFCETRERRLHKALPFTAAPAQVGLLRKSVRRTMRQWGAEAITDQAELAVSELATNVLKHVGDGTPAMVVLEPRGDCLRVEVHDSGRSMPVLSEMCAEAECGRGLHLIAAMSQDWGTLRTAEGKAVWCELSLEPARQGMSVQRAAMVLDEYRRVVGAAPVQACATAEESVSDVIADLLHWLVASGGDAVETLGRARMHFEAEAA
ncbi:ATP-binding protein [Streptomyces sp. NPDC059517]|uniref:ATP-binding protein n=1 Tax=Streptomyces sp. NPDC059517 TaxID=3346855 RepID=UPI00368CA8C0